VHATLSDLQNCWLMFDHVKRAQEWTTMAYHVYDPMYYKVLTITICDMQFESKKFNVSWKEN
jgi:hypothetical protein